MSPNRSTDTATISDIVTACSRVIEYTRGASQSGIRRNHQLASACCYQIAVSGEAVKGISQAARAELPEIPWRDIAGMRDRLIHGCDSVDSDELWKTATEDIPVLL